MGKTECGRPQATAGNPTKNATDACRRTFEQTTLANDTGVAWKCEAILDESGVVWVHANITRRQRARGLLLVPEDHA